MSVTLTMESLHPPSAHLHLSFFTSARDNQPKPLETSWEDLAESLREPRVAACTPETCKRSECTEKHGHAWSPACYPENAPRARSAVTSVAALVLDIDHVPSDENLVEILDKVPYQRIVHGSHSDKPGDRCVRVIVRLSEPVPGDQWPQFWNAAIKHLQIPVDQATKDASRLYFLPSRPLGANATEFGDGTDYLYVTTDGPALDVASILAVAQTEQPEVPGQHLGGGPDVGVTPTVSTDTTSARDAALAALAHAWPAQGRHQASLALTGALAHAKWTADQVTDFLHDLMALVYPNGDPTPRKREDQARDSVAKVERGEPVSGWPSLIPHVGEIAVATVTKALGIGGKPQWLTNILAQHAGPQKPTQDEITVHYKHLRGKLLRKKSNLLHQQEAKILARILDRDQLAEGDEDRTMALVTAIRTLLKYCPTLATHDQLAQLLAHVLPVNVGQDADKPWSTVLFELFDSCANVMAQEAQDEGEFETEASGVRLGKPTKTLKNIDVALKKLKVRLKLDEFANKKLISTQGSPWEVIEDTHIDAVWFEIERQFEMDFGYEKFAKYLTKHAKDSSYHPVRDYLDSLEWDGVPRIGGGLHAGWLHTYGQAPDTEYTRAIGRLVLIAAVRRVREPGCKFDEMMILEGEQGVQKSTALAALCPERDWFSDDLPLGEDSKRVIEATAGKWIVEGSELKGMSPKKVSELKGFLSRTIDEARMAFGREVRIAPRQFIIIGTTNDAQYLHDPTGLRRFWPVTVIAFDVEGIKRDRDQLWAEAAHYEAMGESIRLEPRYYAIAAAEQEERRVVDHIEAIVEEAFAGHVGKVRTLDLAMLLGKDAADLRPDEQRRVGDAMRRIGWRHSRRRINGKPVYVYVKGDKDEQEIMLAITGRKVVRAVGAQGSSLPGTDTTVKVN